MRAIDNYTPEQIDTLKLKGMISDGSVRLQHNNCPKCEQAAVQQLKAQAENKPINQ